MASQSASRTAPLQVPTTHLTLTPQSTESLVNLGIPAFLAAEISATGVAGIDLPSLEDICVQAAVSAAQIVRNMREELADEYGRIAAKGHKSSAVDPVTVVDEASEKFLQHFLLSALPGSAILGEEEGGIVDESKLSKAGGWDSEHGGIEAGRAFAVDQQRELTGECVAASEVVWVVDPIDGTVNFLYGQPDYAVSVAATVNGISIAAAVIQVPTGEVYSARVAGPARYRQCTEARGVESLGRTLRAPGPTELGEALVATGFSYVASQRERQAQVLTQLLPHVRDIRRGGSAALDLCHLAAGTVDVYYEHGLGAWDYAAGVLIAARSGVNAIFPRLRFEKVEKLLVMGAKPEILSELSRVLGLAGAGVSLASN